METADITDRPEGTAQGKSRLQTSLARTVSPADVRTLRQLAKGTTPAGVISVKLQRPVAAVRSKAQREGISLRPINRSPYSRRKKSAKQR